MILFCRKSIGAKKKESLTVSTDTDEVVNLANDIKPLQSEITKLEESMQVHAIKINVRKRREREVSTE